MKISLVDYIGYTSKEGTPIGHDLKALNETIRLLDGSDMEVIAPKSYIKAVPHKSAKTLPWNIVVDNKKDSLLRNLKRALLEFRNIRFAFKNYEADYLWFYNVDQFFFIYCFLFRVPLNNVVITAFASEYPKRYHNYCYLKCLKKIKLAVLTNQDSKYYGANTLFIPDYLYYPDIYDKYKCDVRQERILCLGVMNPAKKIRELVMTFRLIDYPLEIHGYFPDKKYLEDLQTFRRNHIEIINEYIEYEEMLRLIGSVKYVVFPYDMKAYTATTSGILLECVFLEAIPIAPGELLKKNGFEGLDIERVNDQILVDAHSEIIKRNSSRVQSIYSIDRYKARIQEKLLREEQ